MLEQAPKVLERANAQTNKQKLWKQTIRTQQGVLARTSTLVERGVLAPLLRVCLVYALVVSTCVKPLDMVPHALNLNRITITLAIDEE